MALIITLIGICLFGYLSYIAHTYSNSRNKKLLFKRGPFKVVIWHLVILVCSLLIVWVLLPEKGMGNEFLKLHTEGYGNIDKLLKTDLFNYYLHLAVSTFTEMHVFGFIFSLLVFIIWLYYIRSLDFFNKEKISTSLSAIFTAFMISFLSFPLSDFFQEAFNIKVSDNTFNNLFSYCFLGVGIVEELIKVLPIILVIVFSKEIDEPFDLIYYACISALSFSFIQNLIYLREISTWPMLAHTMISGVEHMVSTTIVIYGYLLYRFNDKRNNRIIIFGYFFLGAFIHALIEYFLIEALIAFFILTFIFIIQVWAIMVNNAMNNSKYFKYSTLEKLEKNKFNLAILLTVLLPLGFLFSGINQGREVATIEISYTAPLYSLFTVLFVSKMSDIDLFKGYWRPIKLKFNSSDEDDPWFVSAIVENTIIPINHIGKKIQLHCPVYNQYLADIFTQGTGQIISRVLLKTATGDDDTSWLLVRLDESLNLDEEEYESKHIFVRIRNRYESIEQSEHIKCSIKLIPKGKTHKKDPNSKSYPGLGAIIINGEDYVYE